MYFISYISQQFASGIFLCEMYQLHFLSKILWTLVNIIINIKGSYIHYQMLVMDIRFLFGKTSLLHASFLIAMIMFLKALCVSSEEMKDQVLPGTPIIPEKLWVDKYAPNSFSELLSDEQTNREARLYSEFLAIIASLFESSCFLSWLSLTNASVYWTFQ